VTNYARMYRFGITPWERYGTAAAASITTLLDREETERSRPLGRALDLGCGRGQYTPELVRRGWEAVGIDYVPAAIEAAAAKSRGVEGLSYVAGDVTRLPSAHLGTFDFFLDIGCFQGLDAEQRLSQGGGVSALANPGATLLLLSFGPSRLVVSGDAGPLCHRCRRDRFAVWPARHDGRPRRASRHCLVDRQLAGSC